MEDQVHESERIRVMIAEDNADVIKAIVDCLAEKPNIEIVAIESDGLSAMNAAILTRPDVLVLDLVLAQLDGFAVMQQLSDMGLTDIRIIVLSGLHSDFMIRRALQFGAYYYMVKPFTPEVLYGHIAQCIPDVRESEPAQSVPMDEEMEMAMLLTDVLGMSPHLKGAEYLKAAALSARGLPKMGGKLTKKIYPAVAALHQASASQVERAIRYAIDMTWDRGSMKDCGLFRGANRPSNGEVIQALSMRKLPSQAR